MKIAVTCLDCGKEKSRKGQYCKPCGYKHRTRPTGLKYTLHKENPTWFKFKGGTIDEKGYRRIHIGRRVYKREHILVVEKSLGRNLFPNEVIHHINGNKVDNRLENLQLLTKKIHDAWHNGKRRPELCI